MKSILRLSAVMLIVAALPAQSDRAPDFSITTEQGRLIRSDAPGGRLLVLNFWETACAPCLAELPSLSEFARAFRSKGVVVVAVSADEDAAKYRRFLAAHRIDVDTYRDPAGRIRKGYGTSQFPETYIIQNGRIVRKVVGAIDWMSEDIASFVRKRLAIPTSAW